MTPEIELPPYLRTVGTAEDGGEFSVTVMDGTPYLMHASLQSDGKVRLRRVAVLTRTGCDLFLGDVKEVAHA